MRLGSNSSTTRGSSSSDSHRRYRTRAPTSQVDESLFGRSSEPQTVPERHRNTSSKSKAKSQNKQEAETIQVITKDLIRNLRVPLKDPSGESVILPSAEFKRITSTSRVLTQQEKEAMMEAYHRRREEELNAAEERKRQIYEADLLRKENPALTELELEARDRAQYLVERTNTLRLEREEEIQKLNKLILDAQCQATRDAQIQEKKQIQVELSEEEKRLDVMMEVERRKALETMEQVEELRKEERISGMQQINDQIQQRLEEKQLQEEMKEQERQQTRKNQERMNLEDLQALQRRREEQQRLLEEVLQINAEAVQAKDQRKEEEKLADIRDMEFLRKKQEREAEYEAEQRRIKREKELEIERLRAKQERAKDYKAEQDELRARRNQQIADREWRRKERELAVKKAQEEALLRAARLEQVQCKEHFLSMEAGREKAEFERVLKVQQESISKQMEEEERQRHKALRHAEAIRQQVKEREALAVTKRREIFKEADQMTEEERQRRARLSEFKEKKLKELKATGLPDKYCTEVERKARVCLL